MLGLSEDKSAVHACQRHFPAGVPTKNHPDPNPNLLNPIIKQVITYLFKLSYNDKGFLHS